jgi:CubicO group peptidase (beta-lactamase class C family)
MLSPAVKYPTTDRPHAIARLRTVAVLALLVFARLVHGSPQIPDQSEVPGLDAVDQRVAKEYELDKIGSITIGIVSHGNLIWTKSYGFADMSTKRPADRQTVYRIGSITKMFTGVMLHQLIRDGKVHLSDPVSRFVPEINQVQGLPEGAVSPTILQLATMTGGLAAEPDGNGQFGTGPVTQWQTKMTSALAKTRYESVPGTRYSYSNIGFAALGLALERASGMPYLAWQRERILEPLQMDHTRFDIDPSFTRDLAIGYVVGKDGKIDADESARELRDGRGYRVPIGCIFTTIDDLSRFVAFELGHGPESVLPHASLDRAYAGIVATSPDLDVGYGLGFMAQRRGEFMWLGHSGGVPGYTATMYFDREYQLGVIGLRNAAGGKGKIGRLSVDVLKMLIVAKIDAADKAKQSADHPTKR